MFDIDFYRTESGECPTEEYLDSLNKKLRAKTLRSISILEEFGNELRHPISAPLGDGIFELRTITGSDITRILYFFLVGEKIILTHGFTKKTQKTPLREIERAKKYRQDYMKRICKRSV